MHANCIQTLGNSCCVHMNLIMLTRPLTSHLISLYINSYISTYINFPSLLCLYTDYRNLSQLLQIQRKHLNYNIYMYISSPHQSQPIYVYRWGRQPTTIWDAPLTSCRHALAPTLHAPQHYIMYSIRLAGYIIIFINFVSCITQ